MATTFGLDLILNMQGRRAGARIGPNGSDDVQRIAIARVGIHDKRQGSDRANLFQSLLHFRERDQAHIGIAHTARNRATAHIQHRHTRGFGNFGRQPIVHARSREQPLSGEQRSELGRTLGRLQHRTILLVPDALRAYRPICRRPRHASARSRPDSCDRKNRRSFRRLRTGRGWAGPNDRRPRRRY